MAQLSTPKGFRLHIGLLGRRNVGKSTLLNALARQSYSIVSEEPGTTTDPVEKTMEMAPLGPILIVDAAGIDDEGALGKARVARTRAVFDRIDVAIVVVDATRGDEFFGKFEEELVAEMTARRLPILVVLNKIDAVESGTKERELDNLRSRGLRAVPISAKTEAENREGARAVRDALVEIVPEEALAAPPLVSDLVEPGEFVLLVAPIDKEAPKGRLILPQVQTIRDLLDGGRGCVVVQEPLLESAIRRTTPRPALVVTDSQAFKSVAATVPQDVPLTSFSILFARQKGDLRSFAAGARALARLTERSRVLVAESCAHHPIEEDIGTVKIPRMLRARVGDSLVVDHVQGRDFPDASVLSRYDLIIHCGGCMMNRREILSRVARAINAGVAITNYGMAIAALVGVLDRALAPFNLQTD